ncbi:hypothetical protein C8A00DRAFT_33672 [Chaetomidium leptoderma]|uniref:Uncharacterized protein n=1 Tax=Chaetomidium leptoderma TaxID=669021 RepID=A0AAN6VMM3_9PEZI|nr:hypothetical protein C8A00DRAFT_33672 [Chaetomidium leptoderma]
MASQQRTDTMNDTTPIDGRARRSLSDIIAMQPRLNMEHSGLPDPSKIIDDVGHGPSIQKLRPGFYLQKPNTDMASILANHFPRLVDRAAADGTFCSRPSTGETYCGACRNANSNLQTISVVVAPTTATLSAVRYVDGHFVESYYPTTENTFSKEIRVKGQEYATEIVDTAGQDEYTILNLKHFIGIHGYPLGNHPGGTSFDKAPSGCRPSGLLSARRPRVEAVALWLVADGHATVKSQRYQVVHGSELKRYSDEQDRALVATHQLFILSNNGTALKNCGTDTLQVTRSLPVADSRSTAPKQLSRTAHWAVGCRLVIVDEFHEVKAGGTHVYKTLRYLRGWLPKMRALFLSATPILVDLGKSLSGPLSLITREAWDRQRTYYRRSAQYFRDDLVKTFDRRHGRAEQGEAGHEDVVKRT